MRLITYRENLYAPAVLGVIRDDLVVDVAALGAALGEDLPDEMNALIDLGRPGLDALAGALDHAEGDWPVGCARPLANVDLLAPIPRPRKNIFGIGLNYTEHVAESSAALDTDKDLPKEPVIFTKPPTAVVGPGGAVEHDGSITQQLDWEVELAVIIGNRARRVSEAAAMDHVFGYSIMIDISARDNRRAGQWIYSKGMDTYAPFGPCIVTADELEDPHALDLWLTVNGVEKQRSNTRFMLFKIPELIADISRGMSLEPGDIIATGTPEGVGAGRTPQEWLWPGDVIEAGVDGIGTIRNPVVAAGPVTPR
ncbi:FAA hydrolase family protein [Maritimibacter sp. 55A14]|uniref:fumarylacetoacetate hydrolase family protein n=1 Tax=Maritimibacter sp. 55A14 TaxID=2174844 RepID=UPI000D61A112|nr:fumarylacetoacetate hydrolase family protein [Maritimibacter sp. 55A14]PWE34387.1 FAA hydrolase family protein [Maritimibacter sp. 55A14]